MPRFYLTFICKFVKYNLIIQIIFNNQIIPTMKVIHTIESLDQVKAIADPLRMRLLEAFSQKPMTTKQVAQLLREKPTKLYHHVEALEHAGLLELIETRPNRGTTEKYYQPVARQFTVRRHLLSVALPEQYPIGEITEIFTGALEETAAEIRASADACLLQPEEDTEDVVFSRFHIAGTKAQICEVMKKLREFIGESRAIQDERGAVHYGLTVAFYPVPKLSKRSVKNKKNLNHEKPKKTKD